MRRVVLAAVISLAVLSGGLAAANAGDRVGTRFRPQALSRTHSGLVLSVQPRGLRRALDQVVAGFTRSGPLSLKVPPHARSLRGLPGPVPCAVGASGCSLTPCVEFVHAMPAVAVSTPSAQVTQQAPIARPHNCRRSGGPDQIQRVVLTR